MCGLCKKEFQRPVAPSLRFSAVPTKGRFERPGAESGERVPLFLACEAGVTKSPTPSEPRGQFHGAFYRNSCSYLSISRYRLWLITVSCPCVKFPQTTQTSRPSTTATTPVLSQHPVKSQATVQPKLHWTRSRQAISIFPLLPERLPTKRRLPAHRAASRQLRSRRPQSPGPLLACISPPPFTPACDKPFPWGVLSVLHAPSAHGTTLDCPKKRDAYKAHPAALLVLRKATAASSWLCTPRDTCGAFSTLPTPSESRVAHTGHGSYGTAALTVDVTPQETSSPRRTRATQRASAASSPTHFGPASHDHRPPAPARVFADGALLSFATCCQPRSYLHR